MTPIKVNDRLAKALGIDCPDLPTADEILAGGGK